MPESLADAFEDHFGIRPLEGYGATECAPVIAVNTPGYRTVGTFQAGSRRGTVGRALPGVAVRVVDPGTFEPLPPDTDGMLLVKGPNVMQGYLDRPDLTDEVMRDGWYVTGDITKIDADGFITIIRSSLPFLENRRGNGSAWPRGRCPSRSGGGRGPRLCGDRGCR